MIDNIKIGNNTEEGREYNIVTTIKSVLDIGTLYIPFSSNSKVYEPFTLVDITIGLNDIVVDETFTAGEFVIDNTYKILTIGTTDFTLIGASNNTIGEIFKATGVGTGTGTAIDTVHEYWWVASDIVEPVNVDDLDTYSHRITLIELTKILERQVMPTRNFFQLSPTKPQFTIEDIIDDLIETVPFSDTINLSTTRIIDSVDSALRTKASAVISPDIKLTGRTLKEAFVELFKIKGIDGYPRLTRDEAGNFILTADYFNELKTLIDKELNISSKQSTQNIDKYATSLDILATNQIYSFDKIASSIIEPNPDEWIGIRSNTAILKTDLSFIELNDEIEEKIK